jgi:hypothetical protein
MSLSEMIAECIQMKPGDKEFALFFYGQNEWDAHIGNESEIVCLGERAGEFSAPGSTPEEAVRNLLETLRGVAEAADAFAGKERETWAGTGLPPVGTVCELFISTNNWKRCEVIAMDVNAGVQVSVVKDGAGYYYGATSEELRPIRTPEQIAAEEREKAIQQMLIGTPWPGSDISRRVCEHIYDAGYRKQEAP